MKLKLLFALLFFSLAAHAQIITTIAGDTTAGYTGDGVAATATSLYDPIGVAVDSAGNIYIGDRDNNRIRKVSTTGIITTIAGTGIAGFSGDDSMATAAKINWPYGVAVDKAGNVFFADGNNARVRKIDPAGIITTVAGTGVFSYNGDNIPATSAQLDGVTGVALDDSGNVYITDAGNNRIRKVNTLGFISTVAGNGTQGHSGDNGPAIDAELFRPYAIAIDKYNNIYEGEDGGNCVRKINTSGTITAFAGTGSQGSSGDNGPATAAEFWRCLGIAADVFGNVYMSDANNYRIRKVDASGIVTTIAGTGVGGFSGDNGPAVAAEVAPVGLALDINGNIYDAEFANNRVRRISSILAVTSSNSGSVDVLAYPNPVDAQTVTVNVSSNSPGRSQLLFTDISGRKMKECIISTNTLEKIEIDFPAGLYILTATTAEGKTSRKIIVN